MAVTLSPLAGAGWQFFTNDGVVLTGGLLYTYTAGTTTAATTYTSVTGLTANTNPIVLDSAGRTPYDIWLTDTVAYKFVLKDSNDVLIGTYDNIFGIGASGSVNYTGNGSTAAYAISRSVIGAYINGVYQNKNSYTISGGILTFSQAPPITSLIEIVYN
jgi:hypothetical protein